MPSISKSIAISACAILGGLSLSGCATTKYVDEQIATVNQRIDGVDAKANDAIQRADAANASAQTANQRLDQLTSRVDSLEQRAMSKQPRN